ncbi:MAG: hypothetical protein QOJ75_1840, partial [Chloroflexota bacterium]|nr:hypothetical protein [Chloroflexota bacterium]
MFVDHAEGVGRSEEGRGTPTVPDPIISARNL